MFCDIPKQWEFNTNLCIYYTSWKRMFKNCFGILVFEKVQQHGIFSIYSLIKCFISSIGFTEFNLVTTQKLSVLAVSWIQKDASTILCHLVKRQNIISWDVQVSVCWRVWRAAAAVTHWWAGGSSSVLLAGLLALTSSHQRCAPL